MWIVSYESYVYVYGQMRIELEIYKYTFSWF